MKALVDWVEHGIAPTKLYKVRIHPKTGAILEEGQAVPFEEPEIL